VTLDAGTPTRRPSRERRTAVINGQTAEIEIHCGAPPPDTSIEGPAVVELPESTLLVAPDWAATAQPTGTIVLQRR
jgi:N-methylhydantoinase A/oxoprolinase/acetone carboxylase beta subunit